MLFYPDDINKLPFYCISIVLGTHLKVQVDERVSNSFQKIEIFMSLKELSILP